MQKHDLEDDEPNFGSSETIRVGVLGENIVGTDLLCFLDGKILEMCEPSSHLRCDSLTCQCALFLGIRKANCRKLGVWLLLLFDRKKIWIAKFLECALGKNVADTMHRRIDNFNRS